MREELEHVLDRLREQGVSNIDRLGLAHADSLLNRAALARPEVAALILERLTRHVDSMSDALRQYRDDLQRDVAQLPANDRARAQQWLDQGNLKVLVQEMKGVTTTDGALDRISHELDQAGAGATNQDIPNTLDNELQQQESDILAAAFHIPKPGDSPSTVASYAGNRKPTSAQDTLKRGAAFRSLQMTRSTLRDLGTRRVVARATRLAPKESGPLNPEKLTLLSLVEMQELSDAYLSRFVSYAETLMWLDQVAGKDEPT